MFKVGDKVRVIDSSGAPFYYEKGEIGVITTIKQNKGWPDLIRLGRKQASMNDHRFELVKEEEPMVDFTKPVTTRDGRPVRILCTDRKGLGQAGEPYPIIALVSDHHNLGSDTVYYYPENGKGWSPPFDLINPPVKRYINLFKRDVGKMYYDTREEAEKAGNSSKLAGYIKTVEVEI